MIDRFVGIRFSFNSEQEMAWLSLMRNLLAADTIASTKIATRRFILDARAAPDRP
ncbi:MAG: hypothetical protein JO007_16905 [Alphaproteobacteria bacterium]|nr:hypothetical protein [Alphaproteobacteria bacterium]